MAGRIRSIKPEILEDDRTASLSHEAFRLFIGMLTLSDDHGGCRADPRYLHGQVFWSQPLPSEECSLQLEELAAADLVALYEVRGQRYALLRGWKKHQKVDHPSKPRVPQIDDPGAWKLPPKDTFVYAIRRGAEVKIGKSWDPSKRLASLQTGSSVRLELIAQTPGAADMERDVHQRFAHLRISGEWFKLTPEIERFLTSSDFVDKPRENIREISRDNSPALAPDLRSGSPISDPDPLPVASAGDPDMAWFAALWSKRSNVLMPDPSGIREMLRLARGYAAAQERELRPTAAALFDGYAKMVGDWSKPSWSPHLFIKHWDTVQSNAAPAPAVRKRADVGDDPAFHEWMRMQNGAKPNG